MSGSASRSAATRRRSCSAWRKANNRATANASGGGLSARTAALEQGIGRNRSPVNEQLDGVGGGLQRVQRAKQTDGGIVRRRHDLSDFDRPVLRERDEIGEGPADIHPHPHPSTSPLPTPMRNAECGMRN